MDKACVIFFSILDALYYLINAGNMNITQIEQFIIINLLNRQSNCIPRFGNKFQYSQLVKFNNF